MRYLSYYIERFRKMNRNRKGGEVAPHKSVMLIAVMDEISKGHLTNGYVPVNEPMLRAFESAWMALVGEHGHFHRNFAYPFFHLASEEWWHLVKRDTYLQRKEYSSVTSLRASFYGAILPDDLWAYMEEETSRRALKRALLESLLPDRDASTQSGIAADVPRPGYDAGKSDDIRMVA